MAGALVHREQPAHAVGAPGAWWPDRERLRVYGWMVAVASLVLLADSFMQALGPNGSDFLAFWGAGRVALAGMPAAAYDLAVQQQVQTATGAHGWFAFVNPPPFLFLAAPFGLLPFPLAWLAWAAFGWITFAALVWRAFPRLGPFVALFPGALIAAGHGQTGLVTGVLLVGGVLLVERRPLLAGLLLGALVIKPHLALLVPLWLAAGGRWRAFAAAAAGALGLLAASALVFGPATVRAYPAAWDASAALLAVADRDLYLRMASPFAQLCLVLPRGAALALHALPALAAAAAVALSWRRFAGDARASGAVFLAATALASPYLFNYDLPFLVLPLAWLVVQGNEHGFRPGEKAAILILWLAPYATRAAALPLGLNLMPIASLALLGLVWSRRCCTCTTRRATSWSGNHLAEQLGNQQGQACIEGDDT